jgi:alanyl-tRNA synthetase
MPIPGSEESIKSWRIIADHLRGATFLIGDGIMPSNKGAGYVLRRLIRRAMVYASMSEARENLLLIPKEFILILLQKGIDFYDGFYPELRPMSKEILSVFEKEFDQFGKTLQRGLREFNARYPRLQAHQMIPGKPIEPFIIGQQVGKETFDLYQTYGFPPEIIEEFLERRWYKFDKKGFSEEFELQLKKHQEISRTGAEKKFGGHGLVLDTGELKVGSKGDMKKALRLHTATHLLQAALREVLGNEVHQMGSDITPERARFDFSFSRKMTPEEIKKTETIINEKIKEDLPVQFKEMSKAEAERIGALHFFKEKYPDFVKVYYVGRDLTSAWSREFCGGPHVARTGEIGNIKIIKEEAVSAGVRRIRATVE